MPNLWQRLQGLLFPVRIRKGSSTANPVLELFYFQGRYMLGTPDAVYSDGDRYRPLVAAFRSPALKPHLAQVREVLVLGTGLASAVHVLRRFGHEPQFTLVEIDRVVLDWAMEFLPPHRPSQIRPVHADAFAFVAADTHLYDLLIVDIFFGREVPEGVSDPGFLRHCSERLRAGGHIVLNFMVNEEGADAKVKAALQDVFRQVTVLSFGINKVYIAAN